MPEKLKATEMQVSHIAENFAGAEGVKIVLLPIKKIKKNPDNPRLIKNAEFEKLKQSILDFPKMMLLRPIIINDDGTILGGNMRYAACKELGLQKIPCVYASDLTEEETKQFIIKDNVSFGEWSWDELANKWDVETLKQWGMKNPEWDVLDMGTDFSLPDGDKSDLEQITFTLSSEQALRVRSAIAMAKETDEYATIDGANENSNGNALYLIISQWLKETNS